MKPQNLVYCGCGSVRQYIMTYKHGFRIRIVHWTEKEKCSKFLRSNCNNVKNYLIIK